MDTTDLLFPKPAPSKKKKKVNGFKGKSERICFYCKTANAERHEIFRGHNRQNSIDHGFQIDVCENCHRELTENISAAAKERTKFWQEHFQTKYEMKLLKIGLTAKAARDMWMLLIGKNYLDD